MHSNHYKLEASDLKAAQTLRDALNQHSGKGTTLQLGSQTLVIPDQIAKLILEVLTEISSGHPVRLVQGDTHLSTAELADLLKVSRPYAVRLLEEGKLPFYLVGTHRRVILEDALEFKNVQRQKSLEIMRELMAESQELGLGY